MTRMVGKISRPVLTEMLCIALLLTGAFAAGVWYLRGQALTSIGIDHFWMRYALGVALGHGPVSPEASAVVQDFLAGKIAQVDPNSIPANIDWGTITPFAATHLYLIYLCGGLWALLGLSWASLAPLFSALFSGTVLAVYGLFRLVCNRAFALAGALLFVITPIHLAVLPQLRDYSKAPFILGVIFLLGLAVRRATPRTSPRLITLGAGVGLLVGVGLGFRQDLQICLLPATVVFAVFMPGGLRATWRSRVAALAAMFLVACVAAWPVLQAMREGGGNPAHNILGGFSLECSSGTGYTGPGAELQPLFNDTCINLTIKEYARGRAPESAPFDYLSKEYNSQGKALIVEYARVFPYNLLLRALATFRATLMVVPLEHGIPGFPTTPLAQGVLDHGFGWWVLAARWAPITLGLIVLVALGIELRVGLCLAFLLAFLCAYPALQYHPRHAFHLAWLPWWGILALMQAGLVPIQALARRHADGAFWTSLSTESVRPAISRAARGAALIAATGAVPLLIARLAQDHTGASAIDALGKLPSHALETHATEHPETGTITVQPKGLFPEELTAADASWQFTCRYVALEFGGAGIDIPLTVRYDYSAPFGNYGFDTTISLPRFFPEHPVRFYFPVYRVLEAPPRDGGYPGKTVFESIEIPSVFAANLRGMYLLDQKPELPLYAKVDALSEAAAVARAVVGPYIPKGRMRISLATVNNELDDGDMEWRQGTPGLPANLQPPQGNSEVSRVETPVFRGRYALKQTWSSSDENANTLQLFGVYCPTAKPGQEYDLCLEAMNIGTAPIAIAAWIVQDRNGPAPRAALLSPALLQVVPSSEYRSYIATFTLPYALPADSCLLLTPVAPAGVSPGQTVYWDHWRLAKASTL